MSEKPTPKTDQIYDQLGPSLDPSSMAYFSLCRELERECAELRATGNQLYVMAIELCRDKGWSKHPTTDRWSELR